MGFFCWEEAFFGGFGGVVGAESRDIYSLNFEVLNAKLNSKINEFEFLAKLDKNGTLTFATFFIISSLIFLLFYNCDLITKSKSSIIIAWWKWIFNFYKNKYQNLKTFLKFGMAYWFD